MCAARQKEISKRITWSTTHECMLMDIWQDKIGELRGARKNSHIYQEMAEMLREAGFDGCWSDVRTKIDNLTRRYREEKKKVGPTGGTPSTWVNYAKVNSILGSFKINNIENNMLESTNVPECSDDSVETLIEFDPDTSSCSFLQSEGEISQGPPRRKRKAALNEELLKIAKERYDLQMRSQEERRQQLQEMSNTLNRMVEQNGNFQREFLEILRSRNQ